MHSIDSMSAFRTTMDRPARSGRSNPAGGSSETRWLGARSVISSNQNAVMAVSTRPLSGIGSAITTSKAEMRSDVTNSRLPSPAS